VLDVYCAVDVIAGAALGPAVLAVSVVQFARHPKRLTAP